MGHENDKPVHLPLCFHSITKKRMHLLLLPLPDYKMPEFFLNVSSLGTMEIPIYVYAFLGFVFHSQFSFSLILASLFEHRTGVGRSHHPGITGQIAAFHFWFRANPGCFTLRQLCAVYLKFQFATRDVDTDYIALLN